MDKGHTINVLDHGFVRYVDHMGTDLRVAETARVSYKSPSKGEEEDKKLLGYLYKNRHTSPFEMNKVMFNIKMPIFVARQYIRHRMQNVNEVSARYTELPNEFYVPARWRVQDKKNKQGSHPVEGDIFFQPNHDNNPFMASDEQPPVITHKDLFNKVMKHCEDSYKVYEELLRIGVAREMARTVLPLNIYTEMYVCWDLKNLLHFIELRDDSHAQAEIQDYGKAIKTICKELFPVIMYLYERYKFKCFDTEKGELT